MTEGKPIDLSDEKPLLFKKYCQWLYTNIVPPKEPKENTFRYLAVLYVMGEKIVDQAFQNAIVDAMIAHHASAKLSQMIPGRKVPGWGTIDIIYKGTTERSPARRLFVEVWAFNILPTWTGLEQLSEPAYKAFSDDLLRVLVEKRGVPNVSQARPWVSQPGSYHSKVVILKADTSVSKDENAAVEPASQDEMEISET
jgi:hypothetical protein